MSDEPGGSGTGEPGAEPAVAPEGGVGRAQRGTRIRPGGRAARHGLRTTLLMVLLALTAFAVGLVLFNGLVMPQLIHGRGEVRVPDLVSLSVDQAEQALQALGLRLSRAGERFDPAVARGLILQQDPAAQTTVRSGRRVLVVVSLGEEFSSVPQLFGTSLRGARILIERTGLTVGGITRAPSEDVGAGLVVGSDPPAESVLPREAPVGLLVSTGSAVESFVMPEMLGRDLGVARRQLEVLGFRVLSPAGAGSRGMIIVQEPAAGVRVDRGAVITLQGNGRSST